MAKLLFGTFFYKATISPAPGPFQKRMCFSVSQPFSLFSFKSTDLAIIEKARWHFAGYGCPFHFKWLPNSSPRRSWREIRFKVSQNLI
jgi:hypothetical protein